jgi:hypothetical protein
VVSLKRFPTRDGTMSSTFDSEMRYDLVELLTKAHSVTLASTAELVITTRTPLT